MLKSCDSSGGGTGSEQLRRQPLWKTLNPDQARSFQQFQVQQYPAQKNVETVSGQLTEEDRKLLDKYAVTEYFLAQEFKRGCSEARESLGSKARTIFHSSLTFGVMTSFGVWPAVGVEVAYQVGIPLLSGGVRYAKSRYMGEVAVCDKVIELKKEELKCFENSAGRLRRSLKRCKDDLEDWFREDVNEESLKKMKVANQQSWDQNVEKVREYEHKIQVASFEASANGECTEETPYGSTATQNQIKIYEDRQENHIEGCFDAKSVEAFINAYPVLVEDVGFLQEQQAVCNEQLRTLNSDREKLLWIKKKKKEPLD